MNHRRIHETIEREIAEQAEVSIQVVRLELGAQLAGRELKYPEFDDDDSEADETDEQQDACLLFSSIWTLYPGHTGYRHWCWLGDRDWSDLLNLMDTYRQIRHLAEETETSLWE